jgi:hypothetical protein
MYRVDSFGASHRENMKVTSYPVLIVLLRLRRWVPGAMFAVFILYADDPSSSRSAEEERRAVLAKLKTQVPAGRR